MGAAERLKTRVEVAASDHLLPGERLLATLAGEWVGARLVLVAVVLPAFLVLRVVGTLLAFAALATASRKYGGRPRPGATGSGFVLPGATLTRIAFAVTDRRILVWSGGLMTATLREFLGEIPLGDVVSARSEKGWVVGAAKLVIELQDGDIATYLCPKRPLLAFVEALNRGLPGGTQ